MGALWAASLGHLVRQPAQLALALIGLALGVAAITAVDIATKSAGKAFELSMDAVNGAATHEIVGSSSGIDEQIYVELRTGESVARVLPIEMAPVVEGYVTVGDRAMQLLGIDPFPDARVRGRDTVGAESEQSSTWELQKWFTERGTVMMAAEAARQLGLKTGASFHLQVAGRTFSARLLGQLKESRPGFDTLIFTDIAQAQEWLNLSGKLSRIDLRVPSNESGESALERLRAMLPADLQLREAQRRTQQNLDMARAFTINLQAMSLLALLVSVFLIYSAISFAIVQRRRIFGVLRAIGATRANVLMLILAETVALAIVGTALGILLGAAIAQELIALVSRTINDLYFVLAVNEGVLPWSTVTKAALAGVIVALVAAILPAFEVANSPPQLGLRRSALELRTVRASRILVLVGTLSAIAAAVTVWFSQRSLFVGFVALFLVLIAIAALTPAALRMFALFAARISSRFSPILRTAFGDIAASLSRTGVAVAALGMALAAMIGVSVMVESFRESLRAWLDSTLVADFYISAPGPGFARPELQLNSEVIRALLSTPGIDDHSESRRSVVESERGPITINALRLADKSDPAIELIEGESAHVWRAFKSGSLVVSEPLAWRLKLTSGDTLTLNTSQGPRDFRIVGVYRDYGNEHGTILIDRAVYSGLWRDQTITALGIFLQSGADAGQAAAALRAASLNVPSQSRQALYIRSNAELRALSMNIFERTFVITRVLYWLAGGVAAVGLVSALLAWRLERSRELAILRSLGLTPGGTAVLVESQTTFMGLAAFLAAVPAGLLTAALLVEVINRRAFGWQIDLHLGAAQLGNALLLALAAALVAGIYPAWRSARAAIAGGMREE